MHLGLLRTFISLAALPAKRLTLPILTPLVARIHAQATPSSLTPILFAAKKRCRGWKYKKPRTFKTGKNYDPLKKCFGFKDGPCPCDDKGLIRKPRCRKGKRRMSRNEKRFWKAAKKQEKHWEGVRDNRRWHKP